MSTEVIGVIDRGPATVKDHKGRPMNVNVFIFQTVTNEAAPENVIAFCNPIYREQVRKSLNRLTWVKMQKQPAETPPEAVIPGPDLAPGSMIVPEKEEDDVNPYLLTGEELVRTEEARKAGRP